MRHEGRLADRAVEFALRTKKHLYSHERRAVAERVYAMLRRAQTLDVVLEKTVQNFARLDTGRKDLLRLAVSRILTGEAAEAVSQPYGFGSDVVRAFELIPQILQGLAALPAKEKLVQLCSLPEFLAEKFLQEFGDDAFAATQAMNERAPLNARVNGLKIDREGLAARLRREGVKVRETPLSPLGLILETRTNAFSLDSFREGLFELQDEGSQLLGMLVDGPPRKVIDACAGAGGKTLQLAVQMKNKGDLYALDIEPKRLEALKTRARRAGCFNVRSQAIAREGAEADAAIAPFHDSAERVLVDAPCSGTGTFRRKPDARYRLDAVQLAEHVARQKVLLERFSRMVKPGGRLIYGTCSVLREENEGVVEDFLAHHKAFKLYDLAPLLGELFPKVTRNGMLRLFPHVHQTDGFFGAVLVREKA